MVNLFSLSNPRVFVAFERVGSYDFVGQSEIVRYLGYEASAYVHFGHNMIVVVYVHSGDETILEFWI